MILVVCTSTAAYVFCQPTEQADPAIDVTGFAWNHTHVTVSIQPKENESWWRQSYLEAALNGVAQWNDAIQMFSRDYPEFSYLSSVRFVPSVTSENVSGFDVYIGWIPECGSEAIIGQSRAMLQAPCSIVNNSVCLAARAPSGHVMTGVDMQNLVVHELGHTLGIYHSNLQEDVMYRIVEYRDTVKPLSSLDLYSLAKKFEWFKKGEPLSSGFCPEEATLTLPEIISYYHLPVAAENLTQRSLSEYLIQLLLRPAALITVSVVAASIIAILVLRKRQRNTHYLMFFKVCF